MRSLFPFLLLMTACGGDPGSYCNALVECQDGNQSDFDRCVDEIEKKYEEADRDGCAREYDAWIDCVVATAECDGDRLDADPECDDLRDDYKDCED